MFTASVSSSLFSHFSRVLTQVSKRHTPTLNRPQNPQRTSYGHTEGVPASFTLGGALPRAFQIATKGVRERAAHYRDIATTACPCIVLC